MRQRVQHGIGHLYGDRDLYYLIAPGLLIWTASGEDGDHIAARLHRVSHVTGNLAKHAHVCSHVRAVHPYFGDFSDRLEPQLQYSAREFVGQLNVVAIPAAARLLPIEGIPVQTIQLAFIPAIADGLGL